MLLYFMTIWNILRPFGIIYSLLCSIVCGHLIYFCRFGMFGPKKSGNPGLHRPNLIRIDTEVGNV
jgi:hypothetical protein